MPSQEKTLVREYMGSHGNWGLKASPSSIAFLLDKLSNWQFTCVGEGGVSQGRQPVRV